MSGPGAGTRPVVGGGIHAAPGLCSPHLAPSHRVQGAGGKTSVPQASGDTGVSERCDRDGKGCDGLVSCGDALTLNPTASGRTSSVPAVCCRLNVPRLALSPRLPQLFGCAGRDRSRDGDSSHRSPYGSTKGTNVWGRAVLAHPRLPGWGLVGPHGAHPRVGSPPRRTPSRGSFGAVTPGTGHWGRRGRRGSPGSSRGWPVSQRGWERRGRRCASVSPPGRQPGPGCVVPALPRVSQAIQEGSRHKQGGRAPWGHPVCVGRGVP